MDIDALRRLVDPCNTGIPRRVVYTTHVTDKLLAPQEREIEVLSEICRLVFGTEPREPRRLLERCFQGHASAWKALCDDLRLGYVVSICREDVSKILAYLCGSVVTSDIATACGALICASPPEWWTGAPWSDILPKIPREAYDSFKGVAAHVGISVECIRKVLDTPQTAELLVRVHPGDLIEACKDPDTVRRLASSNDYGALAILAMSHKDPEVGLNILGKVPKSKIDIRVVAAAAMHVQASPDQRLQNVGRILEALCVGLAECKTFTLSMPEPPDRSN